jgi:hypothetical protein
LEVLFSSSGDDESSSKKHSMLMTEADQVASRAILAL